MKHKSKGYKDLIDEEEDDEGISKIRKQSLYVLEEVDTSRFPSSILTGLKHANGEDAILRAEELRPENANEVWVLQCPFNVQLGQLLQGKKLYLDNRPQVFVSDENEDFRYEAVCIPQTKANREDAASAVLPDESGKMQIVSFPLAGRIIMKAALEELPEAIPNPSPKKVHQLPSGVKVRHPIYGTNYEDIIVDLPTAKTKRKKRNAVVEDYKVEEIIVQAPSHKKRKVVVEEEVEEVIIEHSRRRKKRKAVDEEEKIEEVVIERSPPRKKRKTVVKEEELEEAVIEPSSTRKKHKKKKKSDYYLF